MAFIRTKKLKDGGNSYRVFHSVDGSDKLISTMTNKRAAERLADHVTTLAKNLANVPVETLEWVDSLDDKTHAKLAGMGLVEARKKARTLGELLEVFRKRGDVVEESKEVWDKVAKNLLAFFTGEKTLETFTQEDAVRFERWIRETPLNTRVQPPKPYATATIHKRLQHVKTVFTYAEKLGWLAVNPFRFLKSGDSTNPGKLEYVDLERFGRMLEVSPLYWRLVLMFGRFCGVRGSSELYRMEWEDIHLSSVEERGWVAIRACKNARHGRTFRVVPLPAVMEPVLVEWMEQAAEGETLVFPGMKKKQNFSVMTEKLARRAGVAPWLNPWYNLRKSFCTDLIQVVKDIPTYEQITDHGYAISVKHYQIMTGGRLARGMEAVAESGIFTTGSVKSSVDVLLDSGKTPENTGSTGSVPSSVKSSVWGSVSRIPSGSLPLLESRQTLEKQYSGQQKSPGRNGAQRGRAEDTGLLPNAFEPVKTSTCASSGGSEFREKFRLNDVQTETKRGILEAFLALNEQDRLEVLNVLEGVLKSEAGRAGK